MSYVVDCCAGTHCAVPIHHRGDPRPPGSYPELHVKAERFPNTTAALDDGKHTQTVAHRLSVVILTHNEQANLPACLESLGGLDCEILVVDSGSTDETIDIARSAGATVFT